MSLNGEGDAVGFSLRGAAETPILVEGDVLAAPAAVDEAAPRRRRAPCRHDHTRGGQVNPSIRSGTVA
jgi:hypothetical protein